MKKIIILPVIILGIIYAALAFLGSGGDYEAEKLLYWALRGADQVAANPEVAPPALITTIENKFQEILAKYPKSAAAKSVPITLTEFYLAARQYDKAIRQLDSMILTNKGDRNFLGKARFVKGVVYEKQGKWLKALAEFKILRDHYQDTKYGIEAPLYIARHYKSQGKEAQAGNAYNDALLFYEKMERDYSGKGRGYDACILSIMTYLDVKSYDKAAGVLETALDKYDSPAANARLLPYAEVIYLDKLNKPDKLIEIYNRVKARISSEKFSKLIDKKIDQIKKRK